MRSVPKMKRSGSYTKLIPSEFKATEDRLYEMSASNSDIRRMPSKSVSSKDDTNIKREIAE